MYCIHIYVSCINSFVFAFFYFIRQKLFWWMWHFNICLRVLVEFILTAVIDLIELAVKRHLHASRVRRSAWQSMQAAFASLPIIDDKMFYISWVLQKLIYLFLKVHLVCISHETMVLKLLRSFFISNNTVPPLPITCFYYYIHITF